MRTPGNWLQPSPEVARMWQAWQLKVRDVPSAGLGFTHPDGHPIQLPFVRRPSTEEEARAAVAELGAQKVDFIKEHGDDAYQALQY